MVKSLTSILIAALLLLGAALFEWFYVEGQFSSFSQELTTLSVKAQAETASEEDAKAVQNSWEARKKKLHVWIPHNDIARIDESIAESVKLLGEGEFALAAGKIEVALHLCSCLLGTYRPAPENVF